MWHALAACGRGESRTACTPAPASWPDLAGRDTTADRWWGWGLALGCVTLEVLVVGLWATHRGINADEGFYLAAGRHVTEGRRLYSEVFYPQMPYLPWLLACLRQVPISWLALGRLLSVSGAAVAGGILTALAWAQERRVAPALVIGLLYVFSALLINSLAVTKTSGVVNACLMAAFAPLALGWARSARWAFLAGVAAGCAIGVRLPVAPVTLVFAALAWRLGTRSLVAFACGGVVASLPWLAVAAAAPDEFWFCNVAFHGLRREISGWSAILLQKGVVLGKWFLLPQHVVVWFLAAYGCWRAPQRVWPAALCVVVMATTYAAATPTYLEYMSQFFPFALLTSLPAVAILTRRRLLAGALVAVYLIGMYPLFRSPAPGTAMARKRALWDLATVAEVSSYLRQHTARHDLVLSWWEGYPVLSDRPGFVGVGFWESNAAKKLTPTAARRYHVMRREELRATIGRREAAAVVVADGAWEQLRADIGTHYQLAHRIGGVEIHTARPLD